MSRRGVHTPEEFSNRPFVEVACTLAKDLKRRKAEAAEAARAARKAAEAPPPSGAAPAAPVDEMTLFRQEMAGVLPLEGSDRVIREQRGGHPAAWDDDAEAMAELADLTAGRGDFDIADTDEYIEGIAHGLDRRLLKRLRRGFFAVQSHLDLHGKTRLEARELVLAYLLDSRARGRRCVLIVHGRGLNSKDQIPVLKESLKVWLSRGRIGRSVLAFCTARPTDGGAGAVYVLLRR